MDTSPIPPMPVGLPLPHITGWRIEPGWGGSPVLVISMGAWAERPGPPLVQEPVPTVPAHATYSINFGLTLAQGLAFAEDLKSAAITPPAPLLTPANGPGPPPVSVDDTGAALVERGVTDPAEPG